MPGRLRTASSPSSTDRLLAVVGRRRQGRVGAGRAGHGAPSSSRGGAGRSSLPPPRAWHRGPTHGPAADARVRDLSLLPKAHLHLHLTGGMRPATLLELRGGAGPAAAAGAARPLRRPGRRHRPPRLAPLPAPVRRRPRARPRPRRGPPPGARDRRGRAAGRLRLVRAAGRPQLLRRPGSAGCRRGSSWCSTRRRGAGRHRRRHGARRRGEPHPAPRRRRDARAAGPPRAGRGVVGFGLSNDETRGDTAAFGKAFRLARDAGLLAAPHAGELRGPRNVRAAVRELGADRLGHGVRAVEDPALLDELARRGVTCEVCPASNAALGVLDLDRAPVRALRAAGVGVALGADDPLLFRSGLVAQYEALRVRQGLRRRRAGRPRALLGAGQRRPDGRPRPSAGGRRRLARTGDAAA